jgi:hypothetical protein
MYISSFFFVLNKYFVNQNNDNKCFLLWSILAAKFPPKSNVSHISSYKQYEIKYEIDEFPVHVNDIKKIERKINLAINVFGFEVVGNLITDYTLEPLYISDATKPQLIFYILTSIMLT